MRVLLCLLLTKILVLVAPLHAAAQAELPILNPYENLSFNEFIEQKKLGEINENVWSFSPPEGLSRTNYFGNLAYALELYKKFEDANDPAHENQDFEELHYQNWSFTMSDVMSYFNADKSLLLQSRILKEYLTRSK